MKEQALMELKEQTRFYLSTPERAAEALLFVRNLEQFAEELKAKVKERAVEIMDRENVERVPYSITDPMTGEVREWEVRRTYATQVEEYRPGAVVAALGQEEALKFMKVSKTSLDTYLKRESARGNISIQQVEMAVSDPTIKTRKSSGAMLREIKATV